MPAAPGVRPPRIVLTVQAPGRAPDATVARRKNGRYVEALEARGARCIVLDETADAATRAAAFEQMDGLLLTGGADVAGALRPSGARGRGPGAPSGRARGRGVRRGPRPDLPILGVCRGLQMLNVLMGGALVQHVDGHGSPSYGTGPANHHPIALVPGTRLAAILQPGQADGRAELLVNTYHHRRCARPTSRLGCGPRPSGRARSGRWWRAWRPSTMSVLRRRPVPPGADGSTPAEFDRLWDAFVTACHQPAAVTPGARPASMTRCRNCRVRSSRGARNT